MLFSHVTSQSYQSSYLQQKHIENTSNKTFRQFESLSLRSILKTNNEL